MIEAAQKADIITPDTIPGAGQISQLRDDIWWVRMPLPFRLNHVNLYVLRGDDGLTIIDAGLHAAETATHWRGLLAAPPFTQYAVRRILISHHHPDHVGFAASLAALTGAEVLMGAVEEQKHRILGAMGDAEFAALMAARYQEYGFGDDIIAPLAGRGNHYSDKIKLLGAVRVLRAGGCAGGAAMARGSCGLIAGIRMRILGFMIWGGVFIFVGIFYCRESPRILLCLLGRPKKICWGIILTIWRRWRIGGMIGWFCPGMIGRFIHWQGGRVI